MPLSIISKFQKIQHSWGGNLPTKAIFTGVWIFRTFTVRLQSFPTSSDLLSRVSELCFLRSCILLESWLHSDTTFIDCCDKKQQMSQLMKLWYLPHRRLAKAQASMCICAVSPEPLLFAHIKYGSRRRVWPKFRHLAPLQTCTFEEWVYGGRKVP